MAKMFVEKDLSLLEVNPLVVTKEGNLLCLDAKIVVDSNALYCQPALVAMQDPSQDDPREALAESFQLNYVAFRRQYWLYGKRRRACYGHHGYCEATRGPTGELLGRGRRRNQRTRCRSFQNHSFR